MPQLLERRALGSIAAAGESFPLANRQIEIPPFAGYLEVGVEGSATGLVYDLIVGGQQVALAVGAGAGNALPVVPDDLSTVNAEVFAGQRITLRISNPTAGALNGFLHVRLSSTPRMS